MFFGWFLLCVWFGFFKRFALIVNQMLERIWFKVFMIARIDNLSFLASVKIFPSQQVVSASCYQLVIALSLLCEEQDFGRLPHNMEI